jgi:predicted sugar kinase
MNNEFTTVSLLLEIPEDLKLEVDRYLEQYKGMDFDEFMRLAISSLLSSTSAEDYQTATKTYLESIFRRSNTP